MDFKTDQVKASVEIADALTRNIFLKKLDHLLFLNKCRRFQVSQQV